MGREEEEEELRWRRRLRCSSRGASATFCLQAICLFAAFASPTVDSRVRTTRSPVPGTGKGEQSGIVATGPAYADMATPSARHAPDDREPVSWHSSTIVILLSSTTFTLDTVACPARHGT
nr:hypothetical protein CFP56_00630 [Quercus suber]